MHICTSPQTDNHTSTPPLMWGRKNIIFTRDVSSQKISFLGFDGPILALDRVLNSTKYERLHVQSHHRLPLWSETWPINSAILNNIEFTFIVISPIALAKISVTVFDKVVIYPSDNNYVCMCHCRLCTLLILGNSAFNALMLVVGRQEGHLACKNWVVRYWHGCCLERGANDLYMVQLMPLLPRHLLLH